MKPQTWLSRVVVLATYALLGNGLEAAPEDWPMWRLDASRSAASSNSLPSKLSLIWERRYEAREQAWDDPLNLDLMTYDRVFEPIVMGGRLFVGFNDRDKLVAIDADTGTELWSFFAEGPVRLPPVGWKDRVYFCSDDGYLYCVRAVDGQLLWKFSGAPNAQHAIGNQRLTSAWPARGGPVLKDGKIYFAASIWPFMGTFVYALDAETGELVWVNDQTSAQYIKQPHSAPSFAGVAPQGALVATDDLLIVPGGRSVPAVFDRLTGKLLYFEINAGGKGTGGSFVTADEKHFYVHTRQKGTRAFELASGLKTAFMPNEPVLYQGKIYSAEVAGDRRVVRAYDIDQNLLWEIEADGTGDLILANDVLLAAGDDAITTIRVPQADQRPQVVSSLSIAGTPQRLIVADQKLFAIMLDGRLVAFGNPGALDGKSEPIASRSLSKDATAKNSQPHVEPPVYPAKDKTQAAQALAAGEAEGYAFWFGNAASPMLQAIIAESPFEQLAVVDSDEGRVEELRRRLDAHRLYGRITVHQSAPQDFRAPRYVANMLFVAPELVQQVSDDTLRTLYESVRPYGGVLHLIVDTDHDELLARISQLELEQAECRLCESGLLIRRVGPLPGSADWTHQYGDVANTLKSDDQRVKLPLGILWFGGSSNMDVLPRHGHGPPEQVVGGRLFIEGMNCLSARDVYTGRVLWKREFQDLGTFDVYYDATYENTPLNPQYNQVHIPGANGRGTNYVVTEDRIYLLEREVCHVLDPRTGETLLEIHLPTEPDGSLPEWGYLGVYKNILLGGLGFANYRNRHGLSLESDKQLKSSRAGFGSKSLDRAGSVALVGFDRHSGQQLWKVDANHSFWHNGIVAGRDQVFCLDKNPAQIEQAMLRRGLAMPDSYRIVALDYETGDVNWEIKDGVFGTWLGYSEEFDKLLQAGAAASDRLYAEVGQGMSVFDGQDGSLVWKNDSLQYAGPCILHNELIITNANSYSESAGAFFIESGKQKMIKNPLTGEVQPWKVTRAYGCNNIIASEHMLTFRSGAAGFYDLTNESGTGNLGGFKSGCTSNLVVANGVLNAPDYTRTCSCAYQNQTSLALVHMPEIDVWTVNTDAAKASLNQDIREVAINFGAPGDRADQAGNLWVEYPPVAGDSPPFTIEFNPEAEFFQHHSSLMSNVERPWLAASGVENIRDLRIDLRLESQFTMSETGLPVETAQDDAEENAAGNVSLSSSDLELVRDADNQTVGLRFSNLPLAQGSEIREAYLQFTCDEPSSEPGVLFIAAEDVSNAAEFSEATHDLSARTKTRQELSWRPEPWVQSGKAGPAQRTPDLRSLVQAVVNRPDWEAGNSLAFLITGEGKRTAAASTGPSLNAPRLIINADLTKPGRNTNTTATRHYDVELCFAAPFRGQSEVRQFDVYAQGELVLADVRLEPGTSELRSVSHLLKAVPISETLELRFVAHSGAPVLSGIRIRQVD